MFYRQLTAAVLTASGLSALRIEMVPGTIITSAIFEKNSLSGFWTFINKTKTFKRVMITILTHETYRCTVASGIRIKDRWAYIRVSVAGPRRRISGVVPRNVAATAAGVNAATAAVAVVVRRTGTFVLI